MKQYDKEVMEKKLFQLQEHIEQLKEFQKYSEEKFVNDHAVRWGAERGLQLAIQYIIDIGSHLLVSARHNNINDYADVGRKLGKHQIVPASFAKKLVTMIKFRNLLVHEYADIDPKIVYQILKTGLSDLQKFVEYIKKSL